MTSPYPLALEPIVDDLLKLNLVELKRLSGRSKVPFATLYKVRLGHTDNPQFKTLSRLAPHLHRMVAKKEARSTPTA